MTEFEWLRRMRELRQPLAPQGDLWGAIDAAISHADRSGDTMTPPASRPTSPRRWLFATALAASTVLVCSVLWQWRQQAPANTPIAGTTTAPTPWKPSDPRLSGAAIELDAARMELQLAMRQAPASPALQRLLERTELQQTQLRQLARQAG